VAESFYEYFRNLWFSPLRVQAVQAIYVAIIFELLVFATNMRLRRALSGALRRDKTREASERIRRRRVVEGLPMLINRIVLYLLGMLMILRVLGLPTGAELLPVLLALTLIVMFLFKDALRDAVRGYYILYDHLYGPGDRVTIGDLTGVVMDLSLRVTQLRIEGGEGREVAISNRLVGNVVNHSRAQ